MNVMDDGGVEDDSFICDDEVKAMTMPGGSASSQQLLWELGDTMLQQALAHVYQVGAVGGMCTGGGRAPVHSGAAVLHAPTHGGCWPGLASCTTLLAC
jgi:hypothetical protein